MKFLQLALALLAIVSAGMAVSFNYRYNINWKLCIFFIMNPTQFIFGTILFILQYSPTLVGGHNNAEAVKAEQSQGGRAMPNKKPAVRFNSF